MHLNNDLLARRKRKYWRLSECDFLCIALCPAGQRAQNQLGFPRSVWILPNSLFCIRHPQRSVNQMKTTKRLDLKF
jgi:hypothetical protein